jgi:UDP-glucose 4-epimerase
MLKQVSIYSLLIVLLASCSSLKTAFTGNRQSAQGTSSNTVKKETKFLNQIDVPVESTTSRSGDKDVTVSSKKETEPVREKIYRNGAAG